MIATFMVVLMALNGRSEFIIAEEGHTKCVIVQDSNATEPERHAARELAKILQEITGAEFPIKAGDAATDRPVIVVGQGGLAVKISPKIPFDQLGAEEVVLHSTPFTRRWTPAWDVVRSESIPARAVRRAVVDTVGEPSSA